MAEAMGEAYQSLPLQNKSTISSYWANSSKEPWSEQYRLGVLVLVSLLFVSCLSLLSSSSSSSFSSDKSSAQKLPLVNRFWAWEPRVFGRFRFAVFARDILERAYKKYDGKPYLLNRGDTDYVVLPSRYISDLNRLPPDVLNTRKHHNFSLLGHLTGMNVILKTSYHVKTLLSRISPAAAEFTPPMAKRMAARLSLLLPQDPKASAVINPVDVLVRCVSEGLALTLFGPPICNDPELVRLCHEHTKNVFTIAFCMRVIPAFLQPYLVWFLPAKWRLERGWRTWDRIVIPEVRRRLEEEDFDPTTRGDLMSWMIHDAKTSTERDERVLTHLSAAVIAGATYSTANLTAQALMDILAHPATLEVLREELREKHDEVGGQWDMAALDSLYKLESALKESSRLAPGAMFVYQRSVERDVTLPGGVPVKRGQFITTMSQEASMAYNHNHRTNNKETSSQEQGQGQGSNFHDFDGLRLYNENLERHKLHPFRGLDGDILTWGSGRWACPGRIVANVMIKILMVKLIDEYDISFVNGQKPNIIRIHEFLMLNPMARVHVRRREESLGIQF